MTAGAKYLDPAPLEALNELEAMGLQEPESADHVGEDID